MPTPPLPESSVVRVRLIYNQENSKSAGNRIFLGYSGGAPTSANCATLASDVAAAWNTHLASLLSGDDSLNEVDVQDITTTTGAFGTWSGDNSGTRSGAFVTANCAMNIEFDIARRYRGGKPRIYLPAGVQADLRDQANWGTSFISDVQTGWSAFISALEALSVGAMGTLSHVNLSYYSGFKNFTQPSGREKAVPQYRDTALVDTITGYAYKQVVASQRRRRTSTTP